MSTIPEVDRDLETEGTNKPQMNKYDNKQKDYIFYTGP